MKYLNVKKILEVTNGELISGKEEVVCKKFSKDTRIINKGDVYIGIKGETFDGNLFWKQAFDNGAEVVIISGIEISNEDKEKFKNKTIIKVEDSLEALYKIAEAKREMYKIPVIAITGSVGKTSTKDIVASVVSKKYKTLKTIGNNNNNIGLPFTLLRLEDEEAMVLEMGMNHFGEISLLSRIAKPDICIITNIGTSHIGNLGSRENILKAKLEILEGNPNATIIINNDNDLLKKWYDENKMNNKIITYGIHEKSDIMGNEIVLKGDESDFICNIKKDEEKFKVKVPVGGEHFVLNALCAVSVGKELGISTDEIVSGIEEFELTKKRMEITQINGTKIINDAYNASYESMKASLKYLSECKEKNKIAILGDMFELGEYTEQLHRKVGKEVEKNQIDILICSGNYSKYIIDQAKQSGMKENNIYYFEDKEKIPQELKKLVIGNDVILIKASNATKFYELAEKIKKII